MAERPIQNLINGLHDRGLFTIAKAICDQHHVSVEEMLSVCREKQFVRARRALISLLVHDKGMSQAFVSKIMGLEHSSVSHAAYAAKRARVDRSSE